jgi:hypothetical protein
VWRLLASDRRRGRRRNGGRGSRQLLGYSTESVDQNGLEMSWMGTGSGVIVGQFDGRGVDVFRGVCNFHFHTRYEIREGSVIMVGGNGPFQFFITNRKNWKIQKFSFFSLLRMKRWYVSPNSWWPKRSRKQTKHLWWLRIEAVIKRTKMLKERNEALRRALANPTFSRGEDGLLHLVVGGPPGLEN